MNSLLDSMFVRVSVATGCAIVVGGALAAWTALSAPTAASPARSAQNAPSSAPAAAPAQAGRFLPAGIDWRAVVGPPPAPDSCEAAADLATVRFEQKRRSPAEIDASWRGVALEPVTFDQALNARFDSENAPKLHALLRAAIAELRAVNSTLKKEYGRLRPFDAHPDIAPVVPLEEGFSYPSSHSMRGLATALLLANIFPERRDPLIAFGKQMGYSRVVGGVHYPNDVEAAFRLAERGVAEILKSKAWRDGVADAADEVAQVRSAMVPVR